MGLFYFWQRNTSRVFIRTETGIHPVLGIDVFTAGLRGVYRCCRGKSSID